jgi:hypothetical protein
MSRRRPQIEHPEPVMRGPYIVEKHMLLERWEWAGGIIPDEKTLRARRIEVGEGEANAGPMPEVIEGAGQYRAGHGAVVGDWADSPQQAVDDYRQKLALRAASPIRAKVDSADLSDTPLFGQGSLL